MRYYEDFSLLPENSQNYGLSSDVYIVSKEDNTFEIYNSDKLLIATQKQGEKIEFSESYKEYLKDKFKDYYSSFGIDERNIILKEVENQKTGEYEFIAIEEDLLEDEKDKKTKKEKTKKDLSKNEDDKLKKQDTSAMEEELGLKKGDIKSFTLVKGNRINEIAPGAKEYNNVGFAYIESKNTFVMIGESRKAGHKLEIVNSIEAMRDTTQKVIDINRDGSEIKRDAIKGMMKINDGTMENYLGIEVGPYGIIELKEIRRDPVTNEFISTDMETEHQYPITKEVEEFIDKKHNPDISDEMEKFQEKEEKGRTVVDKREIDDERTIHDRGRRFYN